MVITVIVLSVSISFSIDAGDPMKILIKESAALAAQIARLSQTLQVRTLAQSEVRHPAHAPRTPDGLADAPDAPASAAYKPPRSDWFACAIFTASCSRVGSSSAAFL